MKQSPVRNRHCPRYGLSVSNEQLDVLKQRIAPLHKSKDDPNGFQLYAQAVIMFEQDSKTTWISKHIRDVLVYKLNRRQIISWLHRN